MNKISFRRFSSRVIWLAWLAAMIFASGQTMSGHNSATPAQATYDYDVLGRLIEVSYSDGSKITYLYDAAGNRTQVITGISGVPVFSITPSQAAEGEGIVFTVTKLNDDGSGHNVDYATTDGSATSPGDFTAASGTLSFLADDVVKEFTVPTVQDPSGEDDETFTVTLSNPTAGATLGTLSATGTILNDDTGGAAPSFSVAPASGTEGGTVVFTVTKSGSDGQPHNVDYATASGSATSGTDFTGVVSPLTLSFLANDTSKTITITTLQDASFEGPETFSVNLSTPTGGATITTGSATGTINDDEAGPIFAISDVAATEGLGLLFTVTKTGATSFSHNVTYATASGSAVSGTDFNGAQETVLTFLAADTSKTFTITTIQDLLAEGTESFTVTLTNPTAGATLGTASATGTINDDEGPEFSIASVTGTEGSSFTFTVTKTGNDLASHNVTYATANGTAIAPGDYTAKSATVLSFAAGEFSKNISVTTIDDTSVEGTENFSVNLSNPTGGASITGGSATGTINDNDVTPAFSVANVSATEGNGITFTITKTGSDSLSHNVSYATSNGSAVAPGDFTAKSLTALTFTASQFSKTVTVTTIDDALVEGTESFSFNLSNATGGATISTASATGTINDNDVTPAFSVANVSATEGDGLTFTITKTGSDSLSHNVSYATSNGSAVAPGDFTAKSLTALTFTASQFSKTVTVTTIDDALIEGTESFSFNLSNATGGATISTASATGTINDNDTQETPPTFAISSAAPSVAEGGSITFDITKTGSVALSYSVDYATGLVTASSADFTMASGTLTFASTDVTLQVTIATVEDSDFENDEIFSVNLSNPTGGATITTASVNGTIINDDAGPSFSIANVAADEGLGLQFTVTKTGTTAFSHNVSYATSDGTAVSPADFTAKSLTALTFLAGETTKTFTVTTIEDTIFEAAETFTVNLSGATAGATIATASATGTIDNDDTGPAFSIAADNTEMPEGVGQSFTITKTGATSFSHNVSYATSNGSAVAPGDYTAVAATVLTFTAGETSKSVTITTLDDAIFENNETFTVNLSAATGGATISGASATATILSLNPGPAFSINDVTGVEGGSLSFTITKTGATAFSHNVTYQTSDLTATSPADFTSVSPQVLTFGAAETTKQVSITTTNDSTSEPDETFHVDISSATNGASITDSQGVGTITDDDNTAPVAVDDAAFTTTPNVIDINVLINDTDAEGHALTITSVTLPQQGFTEIVNNKIRYTVATDLGVYTFTYTISDGNGGTDTATVTVTVQVFPCCEF